MGSAWRTWCGPRTASEAPIRAGGWMGGVGDAVKQFIPEPVGLAKLLLSLARRLLRERRVCSPCSLSHRKTPWCSQPTQPSGCEGGRGLPSRRRSHLVRSLFGSLARTQLFLFFFNPTTDEVKRHAIAVESKNARVLDVASVYDGSWFAGKRVVITGGAQGLGLELARELLPLGANASQKSWLNFRISCPARPPWVSGSEPSWTFAA